MNHAVLQNILDSHFNVVRQRTVGSPARDYVPILRVADRARNLASRLFGVNEWAFDEQAEKAHGYRKTQHGYISKMLGDLKGRLADGDTTPSILGNVIRQDVLNDEEVMLNLYTGSMSHFSLNIAKYTTY